MMENWKWTAGVLCAYGLFREFRPSEPFFAEYAIDYRGFTLETFYGFLPSTTLGSLISLFVLLCITDFLRYKPVVIFGATIFVATWCVTIWGYTSEFNAKVRQVLNSIGVSSEVAYFTYMYANVEKSHYKQVTSYTHSALHSGRFLAGLCGQLLLTFKVLDLEKLNYASLGGVTAALISSLFLPPVKSSIYFYPDSQTNKGNSEKDSHKAENGDISFQKRSERRKSIHNPHLKMPDRIKLAIPILWSDFKVAYSNRYVLKWSLWWSIAMACYSQVGIFSGSLWKSIVDETEQKGFNGAVTATNALLSVIITLSLQVVKVPWFRWGEMYLSTISLLQAAALLVMSQTHNLYVCYAGYIIFQTLFQVMIVNVTAEVAEGVSENSKAFIFGLNTLLALLIQSVMTYTVSSEYGFRISIRDEFTIYAIYNAILGISFLMLAIQNRLKHWDIPASDC